MELFISVFMAIVILDFTLFGFFSWLFRLYPSYRKFLNEGVLIEDQTSNRFLLNWKGDRYHSLILTKGHLILRNSMLTSVMNIPVSAIKAFEIKNTIQSSSVKKLIVHFRLEDKLETFKVKTKNSEKWIFELSQLGIPKSLN